MAQHDYVIANGTGAAVRSDLNGSLAAIVSNNSGATEPGTMYAYQWWPDTTTGLLKIRNAANNAWVTVGTLASANLGLLSLAGGTMTGALAVTAGTAALPGIAVSGDLNTGITSPGADQLAISTGGTSRLAVSTTAVSSTLAVDVPLGAVGTPSLTFTGDLNTGIWSPAADTIAFSEGGAEAMRIDSSSRLLVGTSSTSANLRTLIQATSANSAGGGNLYLARGESTPANGASLGYLGFSDSNHTSAAGLEAVRDGGTWTSGSSQPSRLVFSTTTDGAASPTERMKITQLGVVSVFSSDQGFNSRISAGSGTNENIFMGRHSATDTQTGTISLQIKANGNVENTNNSYGAISDAKLKENIVNATSQWDDLKALQVRKYNFKAETNQQTHTQIGLVAQEVELVSPGLVSESPDRDAEGNDLGTVTKSVNYSVLYMKAVKALQEAMDRIEALEADVAQLKGA